MRAIAARAEKMLRDAGRVSVGLYRKGGELRMSRTLTHRWRRPVDIKKRQSMAQDWRSWECRHEAGRPRAGPTPD